MSNTPPRFHAKSSRRGLFVEPLEPRWLLSADFTLLKDINTTPIGSHPADLVNVDGTLFFTAANKHGRQLWRSDGTAAGTGLIKRLEVPYNDYPITNLTAFRDQLFFSVGTKEAGNELWRSDGTSRGTAMLKDLSPTPDDWIWRDPPSSSPEQLTVMGNTLYFVTSQNSVNRGLWKTDGTAAGTVYLNFRYAQQLVPAGNKLFFVRTDFNLDTLLHTDTLYFINDGDSRPTFVPGATRGEGSRITEMVSVGGTVFYSLVDVDGNQELWRSNGTENGTKLIERIGPPNFGLPQITNLTADGELLYFTAYDNDGGTELWRSDGTAAGTKRVRDIIPGGAGSDPRNLINFNGTLFFTARKANDHIWLWKSVENGVVQVADLGRSSHSAISQFTVVGDQLFFRHRFTLKKTDGTADGTVTVSSIDDPTELVDVNGTLFLSSDEGGQGVELFKSDGTEAGTVMVKDIMARTESSNPKDYFYELNDRLFFLTDNAQLWQTDGTQAGTERPGFIYRTYPGFGALGNSIYFLAESNSASGIDLWKSDGTPAGTEVVAELRGNVETLPTSNNFVEMDGTLYFAYDDGIYGQELWKTDGTAAGTVMVKDINTLNSTPGSKPGSFVVHNGLLYFTARDDWFNSRNIWVSDGTEEGTRLFADPSSSASSLVFFKDKLFFSVDSFPNSSVWTSDGTEEGTAFFHTGRTTFTEIVGGNLYFGSGQDTYRTDGTSDGTYQTDLWSFVTKDNSFYYLAKDFEGDYYLWRSDGSENGSQPVVLVQPEGTSGTPGNLRNINGTLYFTTDDGVHGTELWQSDGTAAGTTLMQDFTGDEYSSYPGPVQAVGDALFVSASSHEYGNELWVANRSTPSGGWHNALLPADVDGDGVIAPLDPLLVINELTNRQFSSPTDGRLTSLNPGGMFLDVDNDGAVGPLDALLAINELPSNSNTPSQRSEPDGDEQSTVERTTMLDLLFSEALSQDWQSRALPWDDIVAARSAL